MPPSTIELQLVVHLADGRIVTAAPTTVNIVPPSHLLRRARSERAMTPPGAATPINMVVGAVHKLATTVANITKEHADEHRRTARDRDDPRTSNDPSTAAGAAVASGLAAGLARSVADALPGDTGEDARPSLIESTAADPIVAYKTANLYWAPNGDWSFLSLRGHTYDAVARARCLPSAGLHPRSMKQFEVPWLPCRCGFWACTDREAVDTGAALLDVELYGRVIVYERGYRAEKQRVLRAQLRGCHWCGRTPTVLRLNSGTSKLEPLCDEHHHQLVTVAPGAIVFTPELLAERLGVPVTCAS